MAGTAPEGLTEVLAGWEPPERHTDRVVDPWPCAAFAALIDAPAPPLGRGDGLPPLWHWFTLLDHPATAELGEDGHPLDGPTLPPIPGRRRMIAGGRLELTGPIRVGDHLRCRETVADVTVKQGRTGEMAFVTVRRALSVDGRDVGVEDQHLVYRSEPEGGPRRSLPRPDDEGVELPGEWRSTRPTDPVLLARFSALTYNGHRIHYDTPYATGVEGYPDLVVHGPLLALLALELPRTRAPERVVAGVTFRLERPVFLPATVVAAGGPDADSGATIAVGARGAQPSLAATVRFR